MRTLFPVPARNSSLLIVVTECDTAKKRTAVKTQSRTILIETDFVNWHIKFSPETTARDGKEKLGWHVEVTLRVKIVPIELIYITTEEEFFFADSIVGKRSERRNVNMKSCVSLVVCQNMLICSAAFPPMSIPEIELFSLKSKWFFFPPRLFCISNGTEIGVMTHRGF